MAGAAGAGRAVGLVLVAGALAALAASLLQPAGSPRQTARPAPAACTPCHADVVAEWEASGHALAFTSEHLRAEAIRFGGLAECQACHAPEPLLIGGTGLPVPRAAGTSHGVDCVACHALADGVAAARSWPDAPCRPVATAALREPATCGRCHRAVHDDWRTAPPEARTDDCVGCHMAPVARTGGRPGRFHGGRPSREPATLARGIGLALEATASQFVATVTNTIAHNVPGERHFRILEIELTVTDPQGAVTYRDRQVIKDVTPFRGERREDRLAAGQSIRFPWRRTEPRGRAVARLRYKLFAHTPDAEAVTIAEREVSF